MSINKTVNGRFVVRWKPGGRAGRQQQKTFKTKREAVAFDAELKAAANRGLALDPRRGQTRLDDYWQLWLPAQQHRPATAANYASHYRNHIAPTFGARALASIRKTEVQGWVTRLPLAPTTVKTVYSILASVLRAAVQDDYLAKSPCIAIRLPEPSKTQVRVLTPDELERLSGVIQPRYAALLWLGAQAGLRQGEAFGLCLSRVDFLRRELRVDQAVTLTGEQGRPVPSPPKTRASVRTVPLPNSLLFVLGEHVKQYPPREEDGAMFYRRNGSLIRRHDFNADMWRPSVRRAALSGVTFHDLRHTYASTLLSAGVPILDVSRFLGHASITETADTYGHLLPEAGERARSVLAHAFPGSDPVMAQHG